MLKLILGLAVLVTVVALLVLYLTPVNYSEDIMSGTVTIGASSYVYYKFTVPSRAFNIVVEGGVTSISGNYFRIYIMDSTNFFYWQNGQRVNPHYSSEYITRMGLANTLPPDGIYYLVIDNTFSINSQTVVIQTTLTYSQSRF
jgi:hypothetical protein